MLDLLIKPNNVFLGHPPPPGSLAQHTVSPPTHPNLPTSPARSLLSLLPDLVAAATDMSRMVQLLKSQPTTQDAANARKQGLPSGSVLFSHFSLPFQHSEEGVDSPQPQLPFVRLFPPTIIPPTETDIPQPTLRVIANPIQPPLPPPERQLLLSCLTGIPSRFEGWELVPGGVAVLSLDVHGRRRGPCTRPALHGRPRGLQAGDHRRRADRQPHPEPHLLHHRARHVSWTTFQAEGDPAQEGIRNAASSNTRFQDHLWTLSGNNNHWIRGLESRLTSWRSF